MARLRKITRFINHLLISVFLAALPVLGVVSPAGAENVSINLRLPWVSGEARINGGNTYGCGDTHHGLDHYSLDFQVALDRPIAAVAPGTAHVAAQTKVVNGVTVLTGYGNYVWIQHANGYVSLYAHLNSTAPGINNQPVQQGQLIGYAGGSGGHPVHLHFALRKNATDQFNGQAAEPIPMSGYSDFGSIPCQGTSQAYNVNSSPPGGWWQGPTPNDNSKIAPGTLVTIGAHAEANGNGGLDKVDLTYYDQGVGWKTLKTTWFSSTPSGEATAAFVMPDRPYVLVSFDVYAKNGSNQKAPHGLRKFCNSFTSTTCMHNSTDGGQGPTPGGGGSSSPTNCTPGQYQAAVFTDANYGGSCVVKGIGEYRTPEAIGLPNDSISSIKVGSGANVRLCDNSELNSPCEYFSADDPELNNNSINTNTISSMKVEGGGPTTNCQPSESEVAFFMNENYQETCTIRGVGRYDDPSALGLPNDTISSVKVGARVQVRICDNAGNNSPCDQFDRDVPDLTPTTVQNNRASSAEVTLRGGIALCDNTNYGGECKYFGAGLTGETLVNMSQHGFDNRAESVRYDPDWAGKYHIVLYTEQNQTGYLYHADNSAPDLQSPYNNNISSIKIYRHQPPNSEPVAPANGAVLSASTTSVTFEHRNGPERRIHLWNNNGYDVTTDWFSGASDTYTMSGLEPGTYSWQIQGRNHMGEGQWSAVWTFSINAPPTVIGGNLSMDAGTSQSIQVQAFDNTQASLTMSASGLPSFATFTDNGNGMGTLALNPSASQSGQYNITITANDGSLTGSGVVQLTVAATQPAGYQAEYFSNRTLSGTPVLTRTETDINNDWGGGSPGAGVPIDNFSARWTKTNDFAAGNYAFSVTADDGVRLYVDNVLVIDKWIDQGATTYTANRILTAGSHTIKMEYYENGGGAVARMSYQVVQAPAPAPGITSGATYKVINPNGNKALNVSGNGTANGTQVQIWTDNGSTGQKWVVTQNTDGTYKLTNPNSNKVLDVNGGGTMDGTKVQIWTDGGNSSAQKWQITQNADNTYKLTNPNSNKVLDVNGGATADGTKVQIWTNNGSAAQKWQFVPVTQTPAAPPSFTSGASSVTPSSVAVGNTVTVNAAFTSTSTANSTTRIHLEIRNPSDQQVYSKDFDNEAFTPGQTKTYTATWTVPQGAPTGTYRVKGGAVSADWNTWYVWNDNLGSFSLGASTPPPAGTELLMTSWNLVGNNGASEAYQSISPSALVGKTTLRVTYNLHGINALGGDASAIIFDQNGWKFVSLANYGQNGLNGTQTVDIPLSAFGLNLSQPVGTLHTRFWYGGPFTVDITSIQVF